MLVLFNCLRLFVVAKGKTIPLSQLANQLRISLDNEKDFIRENAEKAIRMAAIKTFAKIIIMTPVGNSDKWKTPYKPKGYVGGRARSNWMLGATLTNKTIDSTEGENNGEEYIRNELPKTNLVDNKTYFYNNLPYITSLEYGHSGQTPDGMVRVSLLNWNRTLNKAFKDLKWHT